MQSKTNLLIGCAAGFSGDRLDAAAPVVKALAASGQPACLIFETLAERTLALAQLAMRSDPEAGYEPLLAELLQPVLKDCMDVGIRIVGNFGAANPLAAARKIREMARAHGRPGLRIAVVTGDNLAGPQYRSLLEEALGAGPMHGEIVSASAYIGGEAIASALRDGADVVVCGRVADPSLAVGPAMAHFGWAEDDWEHLAAATMAGHLLECGTQVTGGFFADPGFKDVPDMANLGYPIARIEAGGRCIVSKPEGTGGRIDTHTVREQLLYELHDPSAYVTPDVVADVSHASVTQVGPNQVALEGVRGHPRTGTLKVNVCREQGWLAEGEISYAGARAEARARLAADILRERLAGLRRVRVDLIGVTSILADDDGRALADKRVGAATDVRLRVATVHEDMGEARRLGREVTALYTCGPAGGGGVRTSLSRRLSTQSCLVSRGSVKTSHAFLD